MIGRTDITEVMALEAARGARSGKQGRRRSICNICIDAKTEGDATGKAWRQTGVHKRSDYTREEPRPVTRTRMAATHDASTI